jgi:hypothetical protein
MSEDRDRFFTILRERFFPRLRAAGFKGSGQHLLRIRGETINAIYIQGSRFAGECCVNLGIHFTFLPPTWAVEPQAVQKWREADCEFGWRLSPREKYGHWWSYGTTLAETVESVSDLLDTYETNGEPLMARFSQMEGIAAALSPISIRDPRSAPVPWKKPTPLHALALARIHKQLGNLNLCREYAHVGLATLGKFTARKPALEELANAT